VTDPVGVLDDADLLFTSSHGSNMVAIGPFASAIRQ
jgi:hypothetical protein